MAATGRSLLGRGRGNFLAIHERAFTGMRTAKPAGQAVEDPPRCTLSALAARDDNAEGWLPVGEIMRAVDRIDDPAIAGQGLQDFRVSMDRFFPDDGWSAVDCSKSLGEQFLGLAVGNCDQIVRRLLDDLACREVLVARKDNLLRDVPHQGLDGCVECTHER